MCEIWENMNEILGKKYFWGYVGKQKNKFKLCVETDFGKKKIWMLKIN